MSVIFMLSGQGSQYYHMGKDLYESDALFKKNIDVINNNIRRLTGVSVLEWMYQANKSFSDPLDDSVISSLSIFLIELGMVRTLIDKGIYPDILLGSSLGTFIATVVAGCIDEDDAIIMLAGHGEIFERTCDTGHMGVVLDSPEVYYESSELQEISQIAGINFDKSFILAFPTENMDRMEQYFSQRDSFFQVLPILRAFHSVWIESAKIAFQEHYSAFAWRKPSIPIACASKTGIHKHINATVLWSIVRERIEFQRAINYIEIFGPHSYIDVGPSGTLANMMDNILTASSISETHSILSPFKWGRNNLQSTLSALSVEA